MRCFVAVGIPEVIGRDLLTAAHTLCREQHLPLRATQPQNLHITLKFIAGLDTGNVAALTEQLRAALAVEQPFSVDVTGFGGFPAPARARVLCSLVEDTGGGLAALAERVEAAALATGIPRERRRFRPHITLARSNLSLRLDVAALVAAAKAVGSRRLPVNTVTLYESRTRPDGPEYVPLAEIRLASSDSPGGESGK